MAIARHGERDTPRIIAPEYTPVKRRAQTTEDPSVNRYGAYMREPSVSPRDLTLPDELLYKVNDPFSNRFIGASEVLTRGWHVVPRPKFVGRKRQAFQVAADRDDHVRHGEILGRNQPRLCDGNRIAILGEVSCDR